VRTISLESIKGLVLYVLEAGPLNGPTLKAKVEKLRGKWIPDEAWKKTIQRLQAAKRIFARESDLDGRMRIFSLQPEADLDLTPLGQVSKTSTPVRPVLFAPLNGHFGPPGGFVHGIEEGAIVLINGSAGSGKSWLMLRSALSAAQNGMKVALFHTEMSDAEYANRATRLLLKKDVVSPDEITTAMAPLPLDVCKVGGGQISVNKLLEKAKDHDLVVFDYLRWSAFEEAAKATANKASPIETILAAFERNLGKRILITGVQILAKETKGGKTIVSYTGGGNKCTFTPSLILDLIRATRPAGVPVCDYQVQVAKCRDGSHAEGDIIKLQVDLGTQEIKEIP
jgi:predicted ATP-dependent serine protease